MAIDLQNRVCVITGASEGIGAAVAGGFIKRGAIVIATDLEIPDLPEAQMCVSYDVRDVARAKGVLGEVVERFGKIDAFVANAGIMPRQNWDEISSDDWREVLNVNLDGAWHGAQAAAKHMTTCGYGKIVFVSSVEFEMGVAVHCHYDASKAALIGLTRAFARAVGPQGVRVNCVMPGAVQTESEKIQFPDQVDVARLLEERQCLPARLQPEAIEPVFAFLCSEESDAMTGQVLCADHGLVHY